jgi:hypothetical protein
MYLQVVYEMLLVTQFYNIPTGSIIGVMTGKFDRDKIHKDLWYLFQ